jgi:hypothetical protein
MNLRADRVFSQINSIVGRSVAGDTGGRPMRETPGFGRGRKRAIRCRRVAGSECMLQGACDRAQSGKQARVAYRAAYYFYTAKP